MAEQFSWVPLPYCSSPRCPFSIKSLALSAHVSPQTIHFQVLDKISVSEPGRGPPSCNSCSNSCYCCSCFQLLFGGPGSDIFGENMLPHQFKDNAPCQLGSSYGMRTMPLFPRQHNSSKRKGGTERVTDRKARGLQMEEIGCKYQTFFSLLSGRRKQVIFFSFSKQI